MAVPSAMDLLRVWEASQHQSSAQQALLLLTVAHPEQSWEAVAHMTVGQRDGHLLNLRQQLFGSQLACVANCPSCQERLELSLAIADLKVSAPPSADPFTLAVADYEIQFRLPNGGDLVAIATETDPEQAQQILLNACLLAVRYQEQPCEEELPAVILAKLIDTIAELDPQANVQLALTCPDCMHQWLLSFDIASFLQGEIQVWAYRLLQDVHRLARAYGWSEADVVTMSPLRRQMYVEMTSHG